MPVSSLRYHRILRYIDQFQLSLPALSVRFLASKILSSQICNPDSINFLPVFLNRFSMRLLDLPKPPDASINSGMCASFSRSLSGSRSSSWFVTIPGPTSLSSSIASTSLTTHFFFFRHSLTMSAPLPIATSPEQELAALVSQVMAMSMLAVSFSRRCIDVHGEFQFLSSFCVC